MTPDKSRCIGIVAAVVLLSIAFATLRIVITVNYYDVSESLYAKGAESVGIVRVVFALCLLALGVFAFLLTCKNKFKELPETTHGVVFTGSLCGFMFISSVILQTVYFFNDVRKSSGKAVFIIFILSLLFAALSSLYYFWAASTTFFKKLPYRIFCVMPALWAACYAVTIYFSKGTVINSPERMIIQLSVIMIMLYTVSEGRFHFGIARPRLHVALSAVAVVVIITACVPNFLLTAFWLLPFSSDTVFSVLQVGVAMYVLQRMISVLNARPIEE